MSLAHCPIAPFQERAYPHIKQVNYATNYGRPKMCTTVVKTTTYRLYGAISLEKSASVAGSHNGAGG
jgi:L-fucose mutarotase/ribose pyranase (RbsD/FucU family)